MGADRRSHAGRRADPRRRAGDGPVAQVVRSSHERWDGTGYPDGLAGEEIPLAARVISVRDAFDAMIGERRYTTALTVDEAMTELRRCAGTQFDPRIVELFDEAIVPGVDEDAAAGVGAAAASRDG